MENRCRQFAIQPAVIGRSVRYRILSQSLKELKFSVTTPQRKYLDLVSGLLGEHQAMNAALAIAMVESLQGQGLQISSAAVRQGVRCAVWPGRFEVVQKHPYIVLDGAHNPAAVHVLVKTVQNIFPRRKIILVLGLSRDKDQPAIAKILRSAAQEIILTKARHVRAAVLDEKEWARFFPVSNIRRAKSVKAALQQAKKIARKDEVILVTGSLFVVGEARAICTN
ncbi:MAG: hypothetical protein A3D10_04420 [Omnitrophica WOR_2 bacterium RIFCSPHIGHO2_02_FULL_48_11]|nr:MAG: hypothetical protein A3D10_04420 [Omnitrophica WOR_2 bacterium RIFCSPHIGHO2_02_FULL_48_11]